MIVMMTNNQEQHWRFVLAHVLVQLWKELANDKRGVGGGIRWSCQTQEEFIITTPLTVLQDRKCK